MYTTNSSLTALLPVATVLVILCLPAAANFYIVVSQVVVTVAVVLEIHVLVACYSHRGISIQHLHIFALISGVLSHLPTMLATILAPANVVYIHCTCSRQVLAVAPLYTWYAQGMYSVEF